MKKNKKYDPNILKKYEKELAETNEIIDRMKEDVFGHRVISYSTKDTDKLKNKINTPVDDADKEKHVSIVEPLMAKKSIIPKFKDPSLDSFLDLDTRVSQKDFDPTIDLDVYKKKREKVVFKPKDDEKKK